MSHLGRADVDCSELRNIELIVQERSTVEEVGEDEKVVLGKLQDILYQTEVSLMSSVLYSSC